MPASPLQQLLETIAPALRPVVSGTHAQVLQFEISDSGDRFFLQLLPSKRVRFQTGVAAAIDALVTTTSDQVQSLLQGTNCRLQVAGNRTAFETFQTALQSLGKPQSPLSLRATAGSERQR